jgi:hypothetical protein
MSTLLVGGRMGWLTFVALAAVLLVGVYAVVRLRHHDTDPIPDDPTR